ncbi:hypothetical protein BLCOC_35750 [Blautia coccoides]|uniref:Band 7 domain-containing protein n=1 Tax=Blautia producta TaxID=33035 RepID=A0ABZ0UIR6_9FIRM|nr:SPFH domain-containing protein [Blautia coccoides]TCO67376.1 SPFH domain/Band 7 family protein [Blautia coccoides]WPX75216.1 hypothetical protein BLCOC_35750 [Blautia coccoides]SUX97903.1 membrane protease subunit, stomatin/prohibitin [Blautia coccoides]
MEEKDGTSPMNKNVEERILHPKSGMAMLFLLIAAIVGSIVLMIFSGAVISRNSSALAGICVTAAILILCAACVALAGLKVINPNEALVLALFGKYYGTLNENGFYWVNPFVTGINPTVRAVGSGSSTVLKGMGIEAEQKNTETKANKKVSLKTMTLDNKKQKVNDELGNPIEIGTVVIWKVENATKAVFNVENYKDYLSIQCDALRETQPEDIPMTQVRAVMSAPFGEAARRSPASCRRNCRRRWWRQGSRSWKCASPIWHTRRRSRQLCCRDSRRQQS